MNDIVKICKKHGELAIDKAYYRKNKDKYECRECMREYEKRRPKRIYEGTFAEYHRNHAKKWRQENKDYINELIREDRKKDPEKYRDREKKQYYKNVENSRYKDVLNKHKISSNQYKEIFEEQNGLCAICNLEETKKSRTAGNVCRLALDHNHSTGKIRGLLCHHCNAAIGHLKEDIELLQSAIRYLESHKHIE